MEVSWRRSRWDPPDLRTSAARPMPPLASRYIPVTQAESGPARNARGVGDVLDFADPAQRRHGSKTAMLRSAGCSVMNASVQVGGGQTRRQGIDRDPPACRNLRPRPSREVVDRRLGHAISQNARPIGWRERFEETLMIRPAVADPRAEACWTMKNGPLTLVAKTRSNSASVVESQAPTSPDTPGVVHKNVELGVALVGPSSWPRRALRKNRAICSTELTSP